MKRRWLVVLAVLSFAVTLVLHAPAPLAWAWARGAAADGTVVHGLHGTLAQGGFSALTIGNRAVLGETRWTLQPAWLALLRVSVDLEARGDLLVRVGVSRGMLGPLRLSDLNAAGEIKALLGALGQPQLPVAGQARLDFPLIRIDQGLPVEARGTLEIANVAWTLAKEPLQLGGLVADVDTDERGIAADLASGAGPLDLSGTATLAPDHKYEVHLQLKPRAQVPEQLQTLVRSLGQPDAQGWYHFRRNGTLAPPAPQ